MYCRWYPKVIGAYVLKETFFFHKLKGELRFFLNLDLISGMKYVYLLTENSLVKVGVLRKLFRKLAIGVYLYNRINGAGTMQPLNKALSVLLYFS